MSRHAVVTGGSRGIGAAISTRLLQEGWRVSVLAKSQEHFELFFKQNLKFQKQLQFIQCDLGIEAELSRTCEKLKGLSVDVLINNAGINKIALVEDVDLADWDRIQLVNVKAPLMLTQAVLPFMVSRKWGRIVNIASIFGEMTKSRRVSYTSSKAALIGMTRTVAVDYAAYNVLANSVSPGFLDTELTRAILSDDEINDLCRQIPIQRLGLPAEIADLVFYLSSGLNTLMTGQNLVVDGGFSIV